MEHPIWPSGLALVALLVTASPALGSDPYEDAFAEAAELARTGREAEGAATLERALPLYPQDYALPLQVAWMHFSTGRYDRAERFYRIAMERSPAASDARMGLAASLERLGRCEEAHPLYEGLTAELPAAREGAARCAPAPSWKVTPSLSLTGMTFPGHTYKSLAGSVTPGIAFEHQSGFHLGAAYRYGRFAPAESSSLSAWDQHEAYGTIGYQGKFAGIAAHYGFVYDGSGALGASHHVGLTGRLSPFGDIEVRGSASFYDDMKVLRVEPSWRIPIAFGLSLRPGVAIQSADGEVHVTGMGTLSLDQSRFSLFAGGKYGDEVRPVYFSLPLVYNIMDTITWGAWGGGSVNVSDGVRIHLTYATDRMKQSDGTAISAHALTMGVALTF